MAQLFPSLQADLSHLAGVLMEHFIEGSAPLRLFISYTSHLDLCTKVLTDRAFL